MPPERSFRTVRFWIGAQGHIDVMTKYHARMGGPPYVSDHPDEDTETYSAKGWE